MFTKSNLASSSRNWKNLWVLGRARLGLHLWFARMSLFWHWITTRSVRPAEKSKWTISHIVLTIYIEIYRIFNKISRFLKFGKSTKIFLNISPSSFGSLEKIVLERAFKGQSAFFSYRFYFNEITKSRKQFSRKPRRKFELGLCKILFIWPL